MHAAEKWAPTGARVIWSSKPHPAFIVLWRAGALGVLLAAGVAGVWVGGEWGWWAGVALLAMAGGVLAWSALVWANQTYALTERHAVWASGVVRRLIVQTPLERVQNVAVYRSLPERLLGLGTVGLATAGTDGFEVVWAMVPRPMERVREINGAIEMATRRPAAEGKRERKEEGGSRPEVRAVAPVIGLVGGIGAGKSEVARILERLGCVVVDSDVEARRALERPEVREALVSWWGPRVIGEDGRVDRRVVAEIVFADAAERRRLEELVHPLVKEARREVIERERARAAAGGGARALVIDAPLLYEAGVDRECDAVIFVDAPLEARVERVARTRGWDGAELARRESAQLPVEEKRRRADEVVVNAGSLEELEAAVRGALERVEGRARTRAQRGDGVGGPGGGG